MSIAVVHLVRRANDFADFRQFLDSYENHSRAVDASHTLILAFKGFDDASLAPYLQAIAGRPYEYYLFPDTGFDIGIYYLVAEATAYSVYVFCNSFTWPVADGWVRKLTAPLDDPTVGLSGSSGSWERIAPEQPWPNLHVRTTGFAIRRDDFLSLSRPATFTEKIQTNQFEAGPQSLTRQVLARGQRVLVVDRDGTTWAPDTWAASRTFRPSDRAMLVDGRMRMYDESRPDVRQWLSDLAWTPNPIRAHPDTRRTLRYRAKAVLKRLGRLLRGTPGKAA